MDCYLYDGEEVVGRPYCNLGNSTSRPQESEHVQQIYQDQVAAYKCNSEKRTKDVSKKEDILWQRTGSYISHPSLEGCRHWILLGHNYSGPIIICQSRKRQVLLVHTR
jgi:hypothetical protein